MAFLPTKRSRCMVDAKRSTAKCPPSSMYRRKGELMTTVRMDFFCASKR
jgi:hypothetical protein